MKIAIVGSGLSGLSCAFKLIEKGYEVHLFEKENDLGGLAGYATLGESRFPKTYHHVLKSDRWLTEALNRFKIGIDWRNVNIGCYAAAKIFPFNGPIDLIKFSPLSLIDRLRLGWLVLNTQYDEQLINITVKEWIVSKASRNIYDNFIAPLISTYFGSTEDIAAAYLARRWSEESRYASRNLGYADFPRLIDSYIKHIISKGGIIRSNCQIRTIHVEKEKVKLISDEDVKYDAVVLTCPTPESQHLLNPRLKDIINQLQTITYRACLCLVLRLEEKTSDFYWVNVLDKNLPFIACFEHGNLNSKLDGGLLYVVRYVDSTDELWKSDDQTILKVFVDGLKQVYGKIPKIKNWMLFRTKYGTPIYRVGYQNITVNPYPRVFFAGVYRAFPEIRSSGPAIRTGSEAAEKIHLELC
jgi:protoporphyrinogen oxidase